MAKRNGRYANLKRLCLFLKGGSGPHHDDGGGGGCFGSLLIYLDERFVKDVGNVEIIIRSPRCDPVEIGASLRNIESAFHTKSLKCLSQCEQRRLESKLGQIQHEVFSFETGAFREQIRRQFAFEIWQSDGGIGQ